MFKKGEWVICIINSRASLTVGKEYLIKGVENYGDDNDDLYITNDMNNVECYSSFRFMSKSDFREFKIKEILK